MICLNHDTEYMKKTASVEMRQCTYIVQVIRQWQCKISEILIIMLYCKRPGMHTHTLTHTHTEAGFHTYTKP